MKLEWITQLNQQQQKSFETFLQTSNIVILIASEMQVSSYMSTTFETFQLKPL